MSRLSWALAELQARSQERDKINHLPSLVERIGPSTCAEVLPLVDCFFSDGKLDAIRAFAPLVTDPWACDPICDLLTFSSDKERARKAFDAAAQSRGPPPPAYPDMNPPLNPSPAVYPDLNPHAPSAPPPVVPSFGPSVVPTPPVVPAVPTYRQAVAKRGGPVERHVWKRWTEVFSERGIREDMLFAPRAHEGNLIKRGEHFSIPKMLGFGQPWNEVSPVARSHTIRSHVHSADVVYHLQRRCVLSMDGLLYYFALGIGQEWEKAKGAIIVEGAGVEMLQPEHSGTDGRPFCIRVDSPVTRKPNSSSQGDFILDCRSEQERQTWFNALSNVATARSPPYNEDASNNFNVRITQNGPEIHRMDTPYRNGYDPPPYSQPGPTYNPPPYSQPGYTPAPMPPHSSAPSHGQGRGLDVGTAAVAGVAAVAAGVVGAAIAHNVSHKHKHKHNNTIPQGPPPVIPAPVPSSQTHIPSHPKSAGEFYQIVSAKCSSVVDFTASWCGPCKRITPLFEKLCSEYPDLQFVKVDVDELDTVANDEGIRAMPTFLVFRTSAIVDKVQGANPAHLQAMVSRAAAHDEDAKRAAEAKSSGKGASTPGGQAAAPTPAMQSKAKGASSKGKGVLGQKPASASASASKAGTSSAPPRPKKAKTKAAPRAEPRVSAPLQYTSCNIHVRLSDGKTLAMAFPATTLFKEVLDAVDNERTDGKGPFHLKVPFSSEVLDATKGEKTLAALDVGPRAMLVLVPEAAVTKAPGGGGASVGAGASPIGGLLSWLVAFFMDLIGRVFPRGVGGDGAANQEGRAEDGGNVKRGNEYWNGNSTEFLSPDDAAKADKSKDD